MIWLGALLVSACSVGADDEEPFEDEEAYVDPGMQEGDGKMDADTTLAEAVRTTCSTAVTRGLSLQIAEQIRCLEPDLLVPFEPSATIRFSSAAVLPYLSSETLTALERAAPVVGKLDVNSGLRSVAQQYLLKRWEQLGRCGIRIAASPGRSNHETGRAVDLANNTQARRTMLRTGFSTLANDPVHFDHLASPDLRSVNVEAFQRLWNLNRPADKIAVTGQYDTATATRLARTPVGGFDRGASCLNN